MTYTIHLPEFDEDVRLEFSAGLHRVYQRRAARQGLTLEAYLTDLARTLLVDKLSAQHGEISHATPPEAVN